MEPTSVDVVQCARVVVYAFAIRQARKASRRSAHVAAASWARTGVWSPRAVAAIAFCALLSVVMMIWIIGVQ